MPLGTGNDFSRVAGWGAALRLASLDWSRVKKPPLLGFTPEAQGYKGARMCSLATVHEHKKFFKGFFQVEELNIQ